MWKVKVIKILDVLHDTNVWQDELEMWFTVMQWCCCYPGS